MNIFILDESPEATARQHCDKHVVKMILEYGQMLSTSHRLLDAKLTTFIDAQGRVKPKKLWRYEGEVVNVCAFTDDAVTTYKWVMEKPRCYQAAHINHPCSVWARETAANYQWLFRLFEASCAEYTRRYSKVHTAERLTEFLRWSPTNIKPGELTPFAQAMPEEYKHADAVEAYRRFYAGSKSRFARWTNTPVPDWFINRLEGQDVSVFSRTRAVD